ncbi:DNA polymerase III subunit gamma/tau [Candidatus Peribacteria bacterium]|jgi:DNA polymerase III subunit gamma/tau|nr:DNA polymerase III subunit gamma/tau [Candidatus Peribacteria bacterium]MBT4021685.1 DNA polymerase III subunit gamma/tau [Candidatus Peribacteria bacterium]MBT4240847.1 DNA polymerase III subunit gamma/tau [Candidatus Peribacteria bacterium]MBT4473771.1 DNA polymerase III subunit gamma/tau [Candidatus Peribacteria bacterium]
MSLYLKYRPKSFADVAGQEHVVTTLENAVDRDQLVHAYLFFGSRGTGKTSVARILAKILLIRGIEDEDLQQQIIQSVDDGNSVDLIEIDAASNRGIDDVRDLKEKVQFAPNIASAKVYIVDEVHMMTKEAFNALLKTLEEPPEHAYFILATTELNKVPDTIQSRCQRFPFRPLGEEDIIRYLQNIADKEHIDISRGALRAISKHVNGGMRDAISLLDQLSSSDKVTEEDVRIRIGGSIEEEVEELWIALDNRDKNSVIEIINSLQEKGVSLEVFLRQLLSRAREELHSCIEKKTDILDATNRIDAIFQALRNLRVSPVPSIALEVALVELCMDESEQKISKSAKRVKEVKEKAVKVAKAAKEKELEDIKKEEAKEKIEDSKSFVSEEISKESLSATWEDIVSSIKTPSVRMSLKDAVIVSVDGNLLKLGFSSNFHKEKIEDTHASVEVEKALHEKYQQEIRMECILRGDEDIQESYKKEDEVNMVDAVSEIFG